MIGATRLNQFLSEAFLAALLALTLALSLLQLLLPRFNAFTQKQLSLGLTTDPRIWLGLVLLVLLVGVLAGLYPALFQSRLKPLVLYKGRIPVGKAGIILRQALVVFPFAVSIIMVLATMVVYRQMRYREAKDMGFDN
jgi:putative ABC transport system permease protein